MSDYVILNSQDTIGRTGKSAADSTVKALEFKYAELKQTRG